MSFFKKKKEEFDGSVSSVAMTKLYGMSCVDYVYSDEYIRQQEMQKEDNKEFIANTNNDADTQDDRDALFAANELLEKTKIDRQRAEHKGANKRLEVMAERELILIDELQSMIEANEKFVKEELYGKND